VQRHAAEPARRDGHARARRQPEPARVAAGQVAEQVDTGVTRPYHEHVQARELRDVAEPPGVHHGAPKRVQARPAGQDRLGVRPGGDHRVRGGEAPAIKGQRPAAVRSVDPAHPGTQPQPHPRGIVLQVGDVVVAAGVRAAAARDARARLVREHPVGVQPEVVVTRAPGRGDRVRLLDHERVEAGPADRRGRRQARRARADDHDMLIHRASYRRGHGECNQAGRLTMPVVTIAEALGGLA
jgi:hypothetical protein